MKTRLSMILSVSVVILAICAAIVSFAGTSLKKERFSVKVTIWKYNKLCDLPSPSDLPSSLIYSKGSFESKGCQDIEKTYGHPQVVCVTFFNSGTSDLKIPIEGLDSVVTKTKNGKSLSAIAFQTFMSSPFGSGYTFMWTTKMTGTLTLVIKPKKKADLVFIFQDASPGDDVYIGQELEVRIQ